MGIVIKNACLVNEGISKIVDVRIVNQHIERIDTSITPSENDEVMDASGLHLFPGVIDDQVHFREPGLTHKGNIASESKAAAAGGITSFIEQPNTVPNAVTHEVLEEKYAIATLTSTTNFSFMLGGTNHNIEEVKKTNGKNIAGIKLFLGSSTGNMLVDKEEAIEAIFRNTPLPIATHCEDEETIKANLAKYQAEFGEDIPVKYHPYIRSEEACFISSSKTVELAKKTGAKLHVFHLSTGKELSLFRNDIPLKDKKITAEVCIHHLWFSEEDYETKGNFIKWNPAVKTAKDRSQLWEGLLNDTLDCIATDHAPHTLEEKQNKYGKAPSGGPLVQHALPAMLQKYHEGMITLEKIIEKMCHNPAIIFQVEKRGFVREGYFADLVLVDLNQSWKVEKNNILYHCGWSPFEGTTFQSSVKSTMINGQWVYQNGQLTGIKSGQRLTFDR
ncbi:MAG: dihydroorotase [Flavobacteriales bacterium]|nr:dihydroorotase [Flavobacteriales bacterium]